MSCIYLLPKLLERFGNIVFCFIRNALCTYNYTCIQSSYCYVNGGQFGFIAAIFCNEQVLQNPIIFQCNFLLFSLWILMREILLHRWYPYCMSILVLVSTSRCIIMFKVVFNCFVRLLILIVTTYFPALHCIYQNCVLELNIGMIKQHKEPV